MNQVVVESVNYSDEKIRTTRRASDAPGSSFRQYQLELTDFSRLRFVSTRILLLFVVYFVSKSIFQVDINLNLSFIPNRNPNSIYFQKSSGIILTIELVSILLVFLEINSKVYKGK